MPIRPAIAFVTSLAAAVFATAAFASASPQFAAPQALNSPTTYIESIAAADITFDGWPDVIATSSSQGAIVVFPSTGPAAFGPSAMVLEFLPASEAYIDKFELADFDQDGRMDLFVQTRETSLGVSSQALYVALATGPAEWADPLEVARVQDAGLIGSSVDYDGDQVPDLVYSVLSFGTSQQELHFRRGRGDGTFDPAAMLAAEAGIQSGLRGAADFDGDGDFDLLESPDYSTLVFRRNEGAAGLAPRVVIEDAFFSTIDPVIVDLDSDGDLDIAHANSFADFIFLYINDGAGNFTPGTMIVGPGPAPLALAAADLDLDGLVDLVVTKDELDEILVLRGLGGATFAPAVTVAEGRGSRASLLLTVDLDLDGREDLVVGEYPFDDGPSATQVVSHRSSGVGIEFDEAVSLTSSALGATALTAIDLDGDGDEELLFLPQTTGAVTSMENLGFAERGGFGPAQEIEATFPINDAVRVGDLDGDGDPDLVMRSGTESFRFSTFMVENLGAGGFAAPVVIPEDRIGRFELGDFDGDDDLDLAAVFFPDSVVLFENVGSMQFVAGVPQALNAGIATVLVSEDATGDGVDDLLVLALSFDGSNHGIQLLTGGSIGFGPPESLFQSTTQLFDVAVQDVNADGIVDVVVAGEGAVGLSLIAGRAGGGFDPAVSVTAGTRGHVDAADIDLDGRVDLVASGFDAGTVWLRGLGSGSFAMAEFIDQAGRFALLDVELDGDLDLALLDDPSGEILMLENTSRDRVGTPYCGPAVANSAGLAGKIEAVGTAVLTEGVLTLRARELPPQVTGYFLVSQMPGVTFPVTGSEGRLCLAGSVGRFVGPGDVQDSGPSGWFSLALDTAALPTPSGLVSPMAGEVWYFQAWHRDTSSQGATSNFTDALAITWE